MGSTYEDVTAGLECKFKVDLEVAATSSQSKLGQDKTNTTDKKDLGSYIRQGQSRHRPLRCRGHRRLKSSGHLCLG